MPGWSGPLTRSRSAPAALVGAGASAVVGDGAPAAVTVLEGGRTRTLAAPARGFDVPLSWNDGGTYLAVRSFDGDNATNPGNETTTVIGPDGKRYLIASTGEVIFIGWVAP